MEKLFTINKLPTPLVFEWYKCRCQLRRCQVYTLWWSCALWIAQRIFASNSHGVCRALMHTILSQGRILVLDICHGRYGKTCLFASFLLFHSNGVPLDKIEVSNLDLRANLAYRKDGLGVFTLPYGRCHETLSHKSNLKGQLRQHFCLHRSTTNFVRNRPKNLELP